MGDDVTADPEAAPAAQTPWRRVRTLALEHIAFDSARARTINLAAILGLAAAWPTDRLGLLPVRSVWENAFGFRPYSSGMTRALSRLMHGDLEGAWAFNPLVFLVAPLIVGLVAYNAWRWYGQARATRRPAHPPS